MLKKILLIVLLFNVSVGILAQNNTIENQFETAIKKSNSYQEFKVIKKTTINELQKNVLDTLAILNQNLDSISAEITEQKSEISTLKSDLSSLQNKLNEAIKNESTINFFGFSTTKSFFNIIILLVFGILILFLIIILIRFNNSNSITKQTTISLQENEEEFEQFRQRSLGREQKLRRAVQDEINKNKDTKK